MIFPQALPEVPVITTMTYAERSQATHRAIQQTIPPAPPPAQHILTSQTRPTPTLLRRLHHPREGRKPRILHAPFTVEVNTKLVVN